MPETNFYQSKISSKGLYFPTLNMPGPEQMILDEILLEKAITKAY